MSNKYIIGGSPHSAGKVMNEASQRYLYDSDRELWAIDGDGLISTLGKTRFGPMCWCDINIAIRIAEVFQV